MFRILGRLLGNNEEEEKAKLKERENLLKDLCAKLPEHLRVVYSSAYGHVDPGPWEIGYGTDPPRQLKFQKLHPSLHLAVKLAEETPLEIELPGFEIENFFNKEVDGLSSHIACFKGNIDTGKTTFLMKFVFDWIDGASYMTKYKNLFYVNLEFVNSGRSFEQAFVDLLPIGDEMFTLQEVMQRLHAKHEHGIFLLDNIDLVKNLDDLSEIKQLLKNESHLTVIITCKDEKCTAELELCRHVIYGMSGRQAKRFQVAPPYSVSPQTDVKSKKGKQACRLPEVVKLPSYLFVGNFVKPVYLKIHHAIQQQANSNNRVSGAEVPRSIPAMMNRFVHHLMGDYTKTFVDSVINYHLVGELCKIALDALENDTWILPSKKLNANSNLEDALITENSRTGRRFKSKSIHRYLAGLGVATFSDKYLPFSRVPYHKIHTEICRYGRLFLSSVVHALTAAGDQEAWYTIMQSVLKPEAVPSGSQHGKYCQCPSVARQLVNQSMTFWCPVDAVSLLDLVEDCINRCRNYDTYFELQRIMMTLVPGVGFHSEKTLSLLSGFLPSVVFLDGSTSPSVQALLPVLLARDSCPVRLIFFSHTFNMSESYRDSMEEGFKLNQSLEGVIILTPSGVRLRWQGYKTAGALRWVVSLKFTTDDDYYHSRVDDKKRFVLEQLVEKQWQVTGRSVLLGQDDVTQIENTVRRFHLLLPTSAAATSAACIDLNKIIKSPFSIEALYVDGGCPNDCEDYTGIWSRVIPELYELRLGSFVRVQGNTHFLKALRSTARARLDTVQMGVDMNDTSRTVSRTVGQLPGLTAFHGSLNSYHWPTTLLGTTNLTELSVFLKNQNHYKAFLHYMSSRTSNHLHSLRVDNKWRDGPEDLTHVFNSIQLHQSLRYVRLKFSSNELDDSHLAILNDVIANHPNLAVLDVYFKNSPELKDVISQAMDLSVKSRLVWAEYKDIVILY